MPVTPSSKDAEDDGGYSDDFEDDFEDDSEDEETLSPSSISAPSAASSSSSCDVVTAADFKPILSADLDLNHEDVIGGGGFALVYGGRWRGRAVACKALFDPRCDASLRQEFMDELLVMNQLVHPNVVELLGACIEPPKMIFVMERCDTSLYATLHQGRCTLGTKARVRIAADVGRALAYMHDSFSPALVHRDVKAHNILLTREGVAKLCDFGLVSAPQRGAGTPSYMAPELLSRRTTSYSYKVDVYAFGILLWELLARSGSPWIGYEAADLIAKVVAGDRLEIPRSPSDCPIEAQDAIAECWAQDADARPEMADAVRRLDVLHERLFDARTYGGSGGGGGLEDDALSALMR